MYKKTYSFPGMALCLESEERIKDNMNFGRFLTDEKNADMRVKVICSKLPEKSVKNASGRKSFFVKDGSEYLFTAYFDSSDMAYKDYACRVRNENGITLYVDYPEGLWDSMLMDALDIPDLLLERNAAFVHASFIIAGGEAIIFAGDKQTGKSTQAALWSKHRNALTVNGDRVILKAENGKIFAYGSAFCGSSDIALNENAPLKAVILLGKAKENSVESVSAPQAFRELLGKMTYDSGRSDCAEKAAALAAETVGSVPVLRLLATPDERSVEALEEALCRI
ncbi:MAG: hypothetical protein ACI4IX_02440 [Acutalibacteraceae bacterium]